MSRCSHVKMRMPDIDTEKFIRAVKRYPLIYRRSSPKFEQQKADAWVAVCKEVFTGWDGMKPEDQEESRQGLQKRWKSLKKRFYREVSAQRQEVNLRMAGENPRRRKKYEYFKLMSFLLKRIGDTDIESEVSDGATAENGPNVLANEDTASDSSGSSRLVIDTDSPIPSKKPRYRSVHVQYKILEILQDIKKQEDDGDKQFLLSLIPAFRKLNDTQKFEAKYGILNVLKHVTSSEDLM